MSSTWAIDPMRQWGWPGVGSGFALAMPSSIRARPACFNRWLWLSAVVALFGFGMVLASGCGKTLVRVGGGSLALVVMLVMGWLPATMKALLPLYALPVLTKSPSSFPPSPTCHTWQLRPSAFSLR
jgi:uncharacterized membrane protein YedE/YeeE